VVAVAKARGGTTEDGHLACILASFTHSTSNFQDSPTKMKPQSNDLLVEQSPLENKIIDLFLHAWSKD
jgi:hypothetical protein